MVVYQPAKHALPIRTLGPEHIGGLYSTKKHDGVCLVSKKSATEYIPTSVVVWCVQADPNSK